MQYSSPLSKPLVLIEFHDMYENLDFNKEVAARLGTDDRGKVKGCGTSKGRSDWDVRFGLAKPPIGLRQAVAMTVTHKVNLSHKIRNFNFFPKLLKIA